MDPQKRFELLTRSPFWAIRPEFIAHVLHMTIAFKPTGAWTWEAAKPHTRGPKDNKVAVIPIEGVLSKDGPAWWGSSYDSIAKAAEDAAADPEVKRVLLAVDSPGGEVTGLPETATVLAQVAKVKPVSAIVDGMSASAAYWLTSQASDVALTPSGEVGSVGVRMMHVDISKMLDDIGYKVTELYSGDFKTEWSPYKPLTDEAKADMQKRLEAVHTDFLNAVSAGRGNRASAEIQQARFGEGRMFSATDAMSHGLVDKLQSARDFYRAIIPQQEQSDSAPAYGLPVKQRTGLERARAGNARV